VGEAKLRRFGSVVTVEVDLELVDTPTATRAAAGAKEAEGQGASGRVATEAHFAARPDGQQGAEVAMAAKRPNRPVRPPKTGDGKTSSKGGWQKPTKQPKSEHRPAGLPPKKKT
jgi:hypothetical protein